jgi:hypothetical protein
MKSTKTIVITIAVFGAISLGSVAPLLGATPVPESSPKQLVSATPAKKPGKVVGEANASSTAAAPATTPVPSSTPDPTLAKAQQDLGQTEQMQRLMENALRDRIKKLNGEITTLKTQNEGLAAENTRVQQEYGKYMTESSKWKDVALKNQKLARDMGAMLIDLIPDDSPVLAQLQEMVKQAKAAPTTTTTE